MEIYLNVVEWGPGIYGAEAAAQHYFHKPAAALTIGEAVRLAVVLPDPLTWSPLRPTRRVLARSAAIYSNMPAAAAPLAPPCRLSFRYQGWSATAADPDIGSLIGSERLLHLSAQTAMHADQAAAYQALGE
jgi:hypothetical protein